MRLRLAVLIPSPYLQSKACRAAVRNMMQSVSIRYGKCSSLSGIIALNSNPQHGFLLGMTGPGKSVIIADLLGRIGHRFRFRLIVDCVSVRDRELDTDR